MNGILVYLLKMEGIIVIGLVNLLEIKMLLVMCLIKFVKLLDIAQTTCYAGDICLNRVLNETFLRYRRVIWALRPALFGHRPHVLGQSCVLCIARPIIAGSRIIEDNLSRAADRADIFDVSCGRTQGIACEPQISWFWLQLWIKLPVCKIVSVEPIILTKAESDSKSLKNQKS